MLLNTRKACIDNTLASALDTVRDRSPKETVFLDTDRPRPVSNVFIFSLALKNLSRNDFSHRERAGRENYARFRNQSDRRIN